MLMQHRMGWFLQYVNLPWLWKSWNDSKWRVPKFNNAQNKLKGRSLLLSFLFSYSASLLSPYAPKPSFLSPSFYLFLLHPAHPACSNLWQMMVGWHQNGATGRGTVYTPHSSDKQRETPSDFLLCCSSAPIHFSWHANTCACSEGPKSWMWHWFTSVVYMLTKF